MAAPTPPLPPPPLVPRWVPKRGRVLKESLKIICSFFGHCFGKQSTSPSSTSRVGHVRGPTCRILYRDS
ncbi:unnamed protein product [Dovyalis caffra]|uniref:Uncharacterized protein n=1 Tax=Dovyalis caffra TaxID=77055 RepID=A0AAV1QYN8_9ROSI|nr:unnamed protein product [Dovyalis caffra]